MAYFYNVYGLNVESEFELIGSKEIKMDEIKNIDVKIFFKHNNMNNSLSEENGKNVYVKIKDIGKYNIKNGDEIIVKSLEMGNNERHSAFIMGICFSVILMQRSKLAIHGSAILTNKLNGKNDAIILSGRSGAGKSSLATALIEEGNKFITDDIASVDISSNEAVVYPGTSIQKVKEDIVRNFNISEENLLKVNKGSRGKYYYNRNNIFHNEISNIKCIFEINEIEGADKVSIKEVIGIEKVDVILKNIFYKNIMKVSGMDKSIFNKITALANGIKVYKLIRPANKLTLDDQIEKIKSVI